MWQRLIIYRRIGSVRAVLLCLALLSSHMLLLAQTWSWTAQDIELTGGQFTSLAIDQQSNLHLSYYVSEGGQLKYGFRPAGSSQWFKMTVDRSLLVFNTNITVDGRGDPHICYTPNVLKYAHFYNHKWLFQEVDPGGGLVGYDCSIRVSSDGNPMIVWYLPTGGFRYAVLRDGVWLATRVDGDPKDYAGKWNSMVLDTKDRPQVAYSDFPGGQLRYSRYDGKDWIRIILHSAGEDTGGSKGMGASIALDPDGNPWISYYDEQSLRAIHYTDGKWTKQLVEMLPPYVNGFGYKEIHSNIALDHNGNPHIVFESLRGLEHAWWDGTQWRTQIIVAASVTSYFDNSMVMDHNDVLYVSYGDVADGSLRLATGRPTSGAPTLSSADKQDSKH